MKKTLRNQSGISLVETMVVGVLFTIMLTAIIPYLNTTMKGYTSMEARSALTSVCQTSVNEIKRKLAETKRLFGRTPEDSAFLNRVLPNVGAASLPGSLLPVLQSTGTFSPGSPGFNPAAVGNSLFFASFYKSVILDGIVGPVGVTSSVRADLFITISCPRTPACGWAGRPSGTSWNGTARPMWITGA